MRRLTATLLLLIAAPFARAEVPIVLSAGPDTVAVTLYRDPDRGEGRIDRETPTSFALISETRTIDLPPGVATVRFEGVAGGIVPQSAILFGTLPRERNRDAALLSQAGLVDAYTGQQVILRRTDPVTGRSIEERATIRSAANRLVISTARGAESVYCSGLAQTLIYPGAPATLSAKPVLTMTTKDQPGGRATVTLAYIATGFDWDATYIGTLATDGDALDLFAWLTMASGDETSFVDATTAAVAGRVNRSQDTRDDTGQAALREARWLDRGSQCWPAGTTSDVSAPPPPPPPPAPVMMMEMAGDDIVVTSARRAAPASAPIAVTARAENLADLKLYRIPIPVTVAARSQKQVAFLADRRVRGAIVYRARVRGGEPDEPEMLFRFRNTKRDGLGDPLPAGKVVLYQDGAHGRQLVGESVLADKTTDEEVEMVFGAPQNITIETDETDIARGSRYDLTLRNANPFAVRFELEFAGTAAIRRPPGKLIAKPGKRVWAALLAANSQSRIRYELADDDSD